MRRKTKKMTNRICIMVDDELKHKLEYKLITVAIKLSARCVRLKVV